VVSGVAAQALHAFFGGVVAFLVGLVLFVDAFARGVLAFFCFLTCRFAAFVRFFAQCFAFAAGGIHAVLAFLPGAFALFLGLLAHLFGALFHLLVQALGAGLLGKPWCTGQQKGDGGTGKQRFHGTFSCLEYSLSFPGHRWRGRPCPVPRGLCGNRAFHAAPRRPAGK